jgi:anti-sigma factor RsiW
MKHPTEFVLDLFLDGGLEPQHREEVESHLHACADCRLRLAEIEPLFAALAVSPDEPLRRDLRAGVLAALSSANASGLAPQPLRARDRWRVSPVLRWAVFFQAVLALALLALFIPAVLPDWVLRIEQAAVLLRPPDSAPLLAALNGGLARVLELFRTPLPIPTGSPLIFEILAAALAAWLLANGLLLIPRRNR